MRVRTVGGKLVGIVPMADHLQRPLVASIARGAGLTPGELLACLFLPSPRGPL